MESSISRTLASWIDFSLCASVNQRQCEDFRGRKLLGTWENWFFKALPSEMDEGLTERFTSTLAPLLPSIRESKSARYGHR